MSLEGVSGNGESRVQLIISAKSSGAVMISKLAGLPREEIKERFTQALDAAAVEVFTLMVGTNSAKLSKSRFPASRTTLPWLV